jgi:nucleoside-diphosphate-sugar epimerase
VAKVLITGGAGHLGRLVAAQFADSGHQVALFDRHRPEDAPRPWETQWPVHVGELGDGAAMERTFQTVQPEIVVHLGANPLPSDHPTVRPFGLYQQYETVRRDDTFKSNVLGTYYVLDCAVRCGVSRIVAASSYFALGIGFRTSGTPFQVEYLPIDEDHPTRPEDSYSLSKLLNEEMYRAYSRAYPIQIVALRLLGVYYPGHEAPGRFLKHPAAPSDPRGLEDPWMYVDGRDAARAFLLSAQVEGLQPFEAFFIATGRTMLESPRHWVERYYPHIADKARALGEWDDLISIAKARRLLGYEPKHFWLDEYPDQMVSAAAR